MRSSESPNRKFFWSDDKREFRMFWEVLTLSAPEGARVLVVDMSRPSGQRKIFDKDGAEYELNTLKEEAEALINAEAGRQG